MGTLSSNHNLKTSLGPKSGTVNGSTSARTRHADIRHNYVREMVEEQFVMAIDAADNGQEIYSLNELDVSPVTVNTVVKSYYPKYGQPQDFEATFEKAVSFADEFLTNTVEKYRAQLAAREAFVSQVEASPSKQYVVLEEALPYGDGPESFPELQYIVFPTSEGDKYMG